VRTRLLVHGATTFGFSRAAQEAQPPVQAATVFNLEADLSQVALSWVSAPTPTVDANPRRCHCKGFPRKSMPLPLSS
jgi:hypothetical protein